MNASTNLSSSSSHISLRAFLDSQHQFVLPFKQHHKFPLRVRCSSQSSQTPQTSSKQTQLLISIVQAIPDGADGIKEKGMKNKRPLYNHEKWVEHRNSLRHIRRLMSSLSLRVIVSLVPPVIGFTFVAAVISSYYTAIALDWLLEFLPVLRTSPLPYQPTVPALALPLVVRTEVSYSRYEERRKSWTKIVAGTNDFSRQLIASVRITSDARLKKAILQYTMAFPVALKCSAI